MNTTHCPRGNREGYLLTDAAMRKITSMNSRPVAKIFLPVPGAIEPKECTSDHVQASGENMSEVVYWETLTGSRGWACKTCGQVLRWGD